MTAPPPVGSRRARRVLVAVAPWLIALVAVAAVLAARAALVDPPLSRLRAAPSAPGDPAGTRAWTGTLYLPRGGPYVLGFVAPGPAALDVGGRAVRGRGLVKQRILLTGRMVAIRLAAPPGTRLVWSPPGRRGDPEYVPASALSPAPPATATFDHPGSTRGDALAAWAIVLIAIALAGWLARARLAALPGRIVLGVGLVLAVALAVRLYDLGGAGQTWDEDTYWAAGKDYVQNAVRGDFDDVAWRWNYEHPPVSKYLAGLGAVVTDGYGPARAVSALVMALACALLVPIGARLHRPLTGVAAGLIAALSPHLIAHGKIVGHEAPTALAWMLAWWASLRVWDRGSERRDLLPRLAVVGVVVGVAIMVRFVNLLVAPAVGLTIVALAPSGARRRAIAWGLAVIPAVAVITALVLWPRLWTHPIAHLGEAWDKLKGAHSAEPFLGVLTSHPPRWYFLAYLGATAPLGLLIASAGGVTAWLRARERRRGLLIAAIWLVAPLGVVASPVRQDGVRYVIPCLLVLALLAGAGAAAATDLLGRVRRLPARVATLAPVVALVAYLTVACALVHPYYLDYYGEQVGGTAAVARSRRFEVAWWGEGVEAAIDHVNRHAARGDRVHRSCVEPIHLTWFRGDLWEPVADPAAARWIVHYQPSWRPCSIPAGARRVFTARAAGAPLVHVYRNDGP